MRTRSLNNCAIVLIVIAIIFGISSTYSHAATSAKDAVGYVNSSEGLILRKSASTSSSKLEVLKNNTKVTIIREVFTSKTSTSKSKKWYYVSVSGKKGYVSSKYVDGVKYNTLKAKTTDYVNYRVGAGVKMKRKGTLSKGATITLYADAKQRGANRIWYKTKVNGKYVYLASDYVKIQDSTTTKTTSSKKNTTTTKPTTKPSTKPATETKPTNDSSTTKPAESAESTDDTDADEAAEKEYNEQQARAKVFLDACNTMGNNLVKNKFTYGGGAKKSYDEAIKTGVKKSDCAIYVSWALQKAGYLSKTKTIWCNTKLNGNGASEVKSNKKLSVTYPKKVPSKADLRPGDICGFSFSGTQHTMVYAGKDKNGKMLWYSGGNTEIKNKSYGPVVKSSYNDRPVYVLIRIK